jgi:hypothetical protein
MKRPRRHRRLPPKAPQPPPGFMWWYWDLVPIAEVEREYRKRMRSFDRLPRAIRNKLNQGAEDES